MAQLRVRGRLVRRVHAHAGALTSERVGRGCWWRATRSRHSAERSGTKSQSCGSTRCAHVILPCDRRPKALTTTTRHPCQGQELQASAPWASSHAPRLLQPQGQAPGRERQRWSWWWTKSCAPSPLLPLRMRAHRCHVLGRGRWSRMWARCGLVCLSWWKRRWARQRMFASLRACVLGS